MSSPIDADNGTATLHRLVDYYLIATDCWPASHEVAAELVNLGFIDEDGRATVLGRVCGVELFRVFLGGMDEAAVMELLQGIGVIDAAQVEELWDLMETGWDPWARFRPLLINAYRRQFCPKWLM